MAEPTGAAAGRTQPRRVGRWGADRRVMREQLVFPTVLAALIVLFSLIAPQFATWRNVLNLLIQVSMDSLLALGLTGVVAVGEIDISISAAATFAGVLAAGMMRDGYGPLGGIAAALAAGIAIGYWNGLLVGRIRIPALVATWSTMVILAGGTKLYARLPIYAGLSGKFLFLGRGYVLGIPMPIWLLAAATAACYVLLHKTQWGLKIYAVGLNRVAAQVCGVPIERYKVGTFVSCGLLCGVAGVIRVARQSMAIPWQGLAVPLDPLAAVFLGAAASPVGRVSIVGTMLGALTVGVMINSLTLMGISLFFQNIVKGCVIVLGVVVVALRRRAR